MKQFAVCIKDEKEKNISLARDIVKALTDLGAEAVIITEPAADSDEELVVPQGCQCILSIGGDGGMIRVAKRTFGSGIPLLGINRGHLGYLCDLDEDTVFTALDRLISDDFQVEERMMLTGGMLSSDGKLPGKDTKFALNDVVVSSENVSSVIQLKVYVNRQFLYTFNGDGMIVATPTGSTAYNLSAHGPIVNPKTEAILLTPINPHTMNSRSIVLDPGDEVMIELVARRSAGKESAVLSFDGKDRMTIIPGQQVVIQKAKEKTPMIRLSEMNFYERISRKMPQE